jgi:hypothetical protein
MTAVETRVSRVSIVGRVADELTREDLGPTRVDAALRNSPRRAVRKQDGYFVFADLAPSPPDYEIELTGRQLQARRLTVSVPAGTALTVNPAGEDDLQVIITGISGNRVSFAAISFVPSIDEGAFVYGEGGFSSVLAEPVEGLNVDGAELLSAAGLLVGQALRVVRSTRLLLRPGPYYPFPESTTLVALRVVESSLGGTPIPDVRLQVTAVNGASVTPVLVGGVSLFRADLLTGGTPPTIPFMVGTQAARTTVTNARGDAVFYYAPATPVTSLTVSISKAGYLTQSPTVTVHPGARTSDLVQLLRT